MFRPLRLTPFEWYMFEDCGKSFSMTFMIRLVFSGCVDQDAFVTSVGQAVQRHPLLRAHVTGSKRRTLAWVPADNPSPYLDFGDLTKPICFPDGEAIDLRSETGLRVWVRTRLRAGECNPATDAAPGAGNQRGVPVERVHPAVQTPPSARSDPPVNVCEARLARNATAGAQHDILPC